jgi:hypothetical protein
MRSHLIGALLAGAALLLAAAPSQAQVVVYGPRPIVSVNVPGVSVQVGGGGVSVAAPFTRVYVGPRRVVAPVYGPDVVYGRPISARRAARLANRGRAVRPVYYYR